MVWVIVFMIAKLNNLIGPIELKRWFFQSVFIVFVVLLSIFAATWILEKSLVKQALELEADAFIEEYRKDSSFPLPRTRNLIGYLSDLDGSHSVPAELSKLAPGLYPKYQLSDREKPLPVYVREFDQQRLFLVFEGANIDRLVGVFGLVPLSVILILIYTSSWIAYKLSWRAVSPVLQIVRNIKKTNVNDLSFELPTNKLSGETKELAAALDEYTRRIDSFVERERQFTADVSHELRTPMTVIDGAAQFLENDHSLSEKNLSRVKMIRRASNDVNELINAFFLLARDKNLQTTQELVDVSEVFENQIIKQHSLIDPNKVEIELETCSPMRVETNLKALEIILGNILGNAIKYTENGTIKITIDKYKVTISDTGIGIDENILPYLFERHVRGRGLQKSGEGIGLAIVKRLCDQFDWEITIENIEPSGVLVTLSR